MIRVVEVGWAVVVGVDGAGVLQIVVRIAVQVVRIAELIGVVVQAMWVRVDGGSMLERVGVHSALMVVEVVSVRVIVAAIVPRIVMEIVIPAVRVGRHSMRKTLMVLPLMPLVLVVPGRRVVVMIGRGMRVERARVVPVVRLLSLVAL